MKQAILALVLASVPTGALAAPVTYRFVATEVFGEPFDVEISLAEAAPTLAFNNFGDPDFDFSLGKPAPPHHPL